MSPTEEFKKKYHERYLQAKQKGVMFWPDIIYKDFLVSFALFIALILLATFVGVANEPKADPSDANYIPRPEWYFLFLYEMLKFFPGALEVVGTFIIPTAASATMLGEYSGGGFTGGGELVILGDLRPGFSPAVTLFGGDLTIGSGPTTEIDIDGLGLGQFDQVNVTGSLTLDASLLGYPAPGDSVLVLTALGGAGVILDLILKLTLSHPFGRVLARALDLEAAAVLRPAGDDVSLHFGDGGTDAGRP